MQLTKQSQSRGLYIVKTGRDSVEVHNEAGLIATVRNQRELNVLEAAYQEGYFSGQIALVAGAKGE